MNALLPLLAASLLLSACHDNPLKAEDRPETIHFLKASAGILIKPNIIPYPVRMI